MEIAPDFFDYFEAAAKLLDNDKYVTLLYFLLENLRNSIYNFSNHFLVLIIVAHQGQLWPFLLGTTMGKSSLLTTKVSTVIVVLSKFLSLYRGNTTHFAMLHFVEALYRSDFFPGLGWMLTKSTWLELSPKWPKAYPYCCLDFFITMLFPHLLSSNSSLTRFYLLG